MKISVIASTYNQPRFLDLTLTGYGAQTDSNFDVIVADDGSGPETAEVVERHKGLWPCEVRHVWHEDNGFRKCAILNKAIAASDADYLIFVDGDCVPKPNFVSVHRRLSRSGHYVTGAVVRLSRKTTQAVTCEAVRSGQLFSPLWLARHGFWSNYRIIKPNLYLPEAMGLWLDRLSVVMWYGRFAGANSSCFRMDALAINGFNENMVNYGGVDREFGTRLRNSGIKPTRLRTASSSFHLDHDRPYRDVQIIERHVQMIREARSTGKTTWKQSGTGKSK